MGAGRDPLSSRELRRRVRAVMEGCRAAGLPICGAKVAFADGEPIIEAIVNQDSETEIAPASNRVDLDAFKQHLQAHHAARRP